MSNKTRLQTNNINIQSLIDKANSLPDAGSGGGGSAESYTVTIEGSQNFPLSFSANAYFYDARGGTTFYDIWGSNMPYTLTNVSKGMLVLLDRSFSGALQGAYAVSGDIYDVQNYDGIIAIFDVSSDGTIVIE